MIGFCLAYIICAHNWNGWFDPTKCEQRIISKINPSRFGLGIDYKAKIDAGDGTFILPVEFPCRSEI